MTTRMVAHESPERWMRWWGRLFGCALVVVASVAAVRCGVVAGQEFRVGSVWFVSDEEGWVIGAYDGCEGQCTRIRHTTDGGRSWRPVPDMPFTPSLVVFADSRNWFASYRPPLGEDAATQLWATHDGGHRWGRVTLPGTRLLEYIVEPVVGNGTVQVPSFDPHTTEMVVLEGSLDADRFERSAPLRIVVDAALYSSRSHEFDMVRAGTATWFGGTDSPTASVAPDRQARLVDGRWSTWEMPCAQRTRPRLRAPAVSTLLVSCPAAAEASFGPHDLFVSTDGGDGFTHRAVLPAALTAAASAEDLLVVAADPADDTRIGVLTSHDGGRNWQTTLDPPAPRGMRGNALVSRGAYFTPRVGFVELVYVGEAPDGESHIHVTRDGGDTWNRLEID